ncbi:hypothetical protein DC366_02650 [Pelagivirga sediminicola]|uniref:YbjN domain-containing protein n=1 Tax=Pelagivirga sediminicola TaxID=2170575 RepID=A0A2T7GBS4_9RHOB|nr:hypothetical protein DC366_02650 [Pelagivirga sediminicola]
MLAIWAALVFPGAPVHAATAERAAGEAGAIMRPMTAERLSRIVAALDPDATRHGKGWRLIVGGQIVLLTADAEAGRLRAMVPIRSTDGLEAADLTRLMQANFDAALDGRYAIARGILWSVFVHPLPTLDKDHLIAGLAQVATLAQTYGTLYSGGALQFGGGDSGDLQRSLIDELTRRGDDI